MTAVLFTITSLSCLELAGQKYNRACLVVVKEAKEMAAGIRTS